MSKCGVCKLIFYKIPSLSNVALYDDFVTIVSANAVKIINVSLGECETGAEGTTATSTDDQFAIAVAQGQTFSISTGDSGADECCMTSRYHAVAPGTATCGNTSSPRRERDSRAPDPTTDAGGQRERCRPVQRKARAPTSRRHRGRSASSDTIGGSPTRCPATRRRNPLRDVADIQPSTPIRTPVAAGYYVGRRWSRIWRWSVPRQSLFAGTRARMRHGSIPRSASRAPVIYALVPDAGAFERCAGHADGQWNGGETAATNYDSASGRGSLKVGTAITDAAGLGNQPPVASFSWVKTGQTVAFTDTSTFTNTDGDSGIASYSWKFGDGGTSTLANPTHAYAAAGTYTVGETVKDKVGASGLDRAQAHRGQAAAVAAQEHARLENPALDPRRWSQPVRGGRGVLTGNAAPCASVAAGSRRSVAPPA